MKMTTSLKMSVTQDGSSIPSITGPVFLVETNKTFAKMNTILTGRLLIAAAGLELQLTTDPGSSSSKLKQEAKLSGGA